MSRENVSIKEDLDGIYATSHTTVEGPINLKYTAYL